MLYRNLHNCYTNFHPSPCHAQARRSFSLWSMKKDPDLEKALSRNRRWIVNNQIKNILLRCPNQVLPVSHLQKKFKSLDLQGKALNWLKKYPNCFQIYLHNKEYHCRLTKQVMDLVEEEESVKKMQDPVFVDRLAKILLMSVNQRLNLIKLNELKRSFGFPDDYLGRVLSKNPEMFRLVNGKEIELVSCDHHHHRLAVSAIEATAMKTGSNPCYRCSLPESWVKMRERFDEFNSTPYVSPYSDTKLLARDPSLIEKKVVGIVHELLSLSLWKKMSIVKLDHFRREFGFPEKLNVLLMRHPGVFYVTNKYKVCTVVLREGYRGSELVEKDELVVVKERFGELMQGGYGGGERRRLVKERCDEDDKNSEEDKEDKKLGLFDPQVRKRFYDILLGDDDDPRGST